MNQPAAWNRIPTLSPERVVSLSTSTARPPSSLPRPLLAHGNGRSYGDVCLSDQGTVLATPAMDRFLTFDESTGVIRCEAGVTLGALLALTVPRGWFLPVSPGTQWATLGGAIANDVHGKNHHAMGSFGHHVRAFELWRSDGKVLTCGPEQNEEWFRATVGGLGLTGLLRWVELQLIPVATPYMNVEAQRFSNLDAFWRLNREAELRWPYTVAWIDCLARGSKMGRGILFSADHASEVTERIRAPRRRWGFPVDPPFSLVNGLSLRAFNALYFRQPLRPGPVLQHYLPYFYPLDAIEGWNKMYGRKGFYQYQCVIPPGAAEAATAELLKTIAEKGEGSFLVVLKTFGPRPSLGMLSFPRAGATLALDFPNRGQKTLALLEALDRIVSEAGGALYPAKDARMSAELFRSSFPAWEAFSSFIDPQFSSAFWRRVCP